MISRGYSDLRGGRHADIADVVSSSLAPHDGGFGRFALTGPSARLAAPQALGLSLALHELAKNAAKYGALSSDQGKVLINWTFDDVGEFVLDWTESGGPEVIVPTWTGFGSQLISQMVAPYFQAKADLTYHPQGARFSMRGNQPVIDADRP